MGKDAAFATLGLAAGASPTEITRAFRARSRALHPDMGGDAHLFAGVVTAYRTLQRLGFLGREDSAPSTTPVGPTTAVASAPASPSRSTEAVPSDRVSPVASRYRRFLDDLAFVASMPDAWTIAGRESARDVGYAVDESGAHFEEILDREMRRAMSAAA